MRQTLHEALHETWEQDEQWSITELFPHACSVMLDSSEFRVWGWHRVWMKPSQRQLPRIRIEKKGGEK